MLSKAAFCTHFSQRSRGSWGIGLIGQRLHSRVHDPSHSRLKLKNIDRYILSMKNVLFYFFVTHMHFLKKFNLVPRAFLRRGEEKSPGNEVEKN